MQYIINGNDAADMPQLVITGGGTAPLGSDITVGFANQGSLSVSGGTISNVGGIVAAIAGSSGSVSVSGAGSEWNNSSQLIVGQFGTGDMTVELGGVVTNTMGGVGEMPLSFGTVAVSDPGSNWMITGPFEIGDEGFGSLTIDNGAEVSQIPIDPFDTLSIGTALTGYGTVSVSGDESKLSGSNLRIADFGNGILTVNGGGEVSITDSTLIGLEDSSDGSNSR